MAKVYIDPGHGGADNGAVKYVTEDKVNLVMGLACRDYLKAHGVEVKMSRTTDTGTSINTMASAANKWGADLVVSIHNNAGGGDGFEVFHSLTGGKGKTLAKNIETEVKKIGQNSRGLKTKEGENGDFFGMIRLTKAPAVICEGGFVDNKKDAAQIDTKAEQQAFGYAYARGILKTLGIKDKGYPTAEKKPAATKPAATKPAASTAAKTEATVSISLPVLKKGDKGSSVKAMQQLIEAAGYSVGSAGADGDFGAGTERGLIKYQLKKGGSGDGVCGVWTWEKLLK